MILNADFSQRVVIAFAQTPFVPSPEQGVRRKMLERIGGEVARATTIVEFARGSTFSAHTHHGGEEYFVLSGVFQDEEGDFGEGSYVRNPPTSRHAPSAVGGAIIFVKLHQFDPADRKVVRADMNAHAPADPDRPGVRTLLLHRDEREEVCVATLLPGSILEFTDPGGAELFVLSGAVHERDDTLAKWDWLRVPPGADLCAVAGDKGARIWLKTGHLRNVIGAHLAEAAEAGAELSRS